MNALEKQLHSFCKLFTKVACFERPSIRLVSSSKFIELNHWKKLSPNLASQLTNELVVSSNVEAPMNKIALWISVCVDDCRAKIVIMDNNAYQYLL